MKMNFLEYSKSTFLVYDFENDQEIRVFTRKKRFFCYLMIILTTFELIKTTFHAFVNDNLLRLYMADFQCTMSKDQNIFNLSIAVTHAAMIRMYIYLLFNENNLSKFQWLKFLKIQDPRILVEKHFFSYFEAESYLRFVRLFKKLVKQNEFFYIFGCIGVVGRVFSFAFKEIPIYWFLGSTLTNGFVYLFMTSCSYYMYNYFITIYFATCTFSAKSFKSLSSHYPSSSLYQLRRSKLNQLAKQNLIQFNYLIKMFKFGQSNFNYTFSYCSGLIAICYRYVCCTFLYYY